MSATTLGKRKARDGETQSHSIHSHGSTLFVSNLPYDATSTDLQTAFSDFAPVRFAFVVLKHGTGVSKGVGYVSFSIKEDAQTALESIATNGMTINGRNIRVQWAESKPKNKTEDGPKVEKTTTETPVRRLQVQKANNPLAIRTVVVSGLPPSINQNSSWKKLRKSDGAESAEDDAENDVEMDDAGADEDSEIDSEQLGIHERGSEDVDNELLEHESEDEPPKKPQLPHTDTGNTVFIRNIPFTATEDEIRALFRAFGPLRYVRLTTDPDTDHPRGTGFACFWNKEDADKAIREGEILRAETTGTQRQLPKNPFSLPSLLTPDPTAGVAKNLVLHGRTLDVVRAVTREQAAKLKEDGEKGREKADKRNLYLLREGVILPNSPAAETIPQVELEKRTNSFNARRTMLRSNPSLYVSKTRLSIRQIPLFVTERVLKRLAIHSVREFNAEVKKGVREGLSPDELAEPINADDQDNIKSKGGATSKKGSAKGGRSTGVKQAKIVRQLDRVDAVTGRGRSRGYGFIEMNTHVDALRVLRWANNNADVGILFDKWYKEELADLMKQEKTKESPDEARIKRMEKEKEMPSKHAKGTLIVEFSIENIQVVQRRAAQKEKSLQSQTARKVVPSSEEPHSKKRRVSADETKVVKSVQIKEETAKPGKTIGSVIGRKRRMRKAGKSPRW